MGGGEDFFLSALRRGSWLYLVLFSALILFFSFFYSSIIFNTTDVANNLKKSNCFILGIRPGINTSNYLDKIIARLTFLGAVYLIIICIIPEILITKYSIPLHIGGTGILILVNVILDLVVQVQSHSFAGKYSGNAKRRRVRMRG
jgi:preprotein translocase subunit SecY